MLSRRDYNIANTAIMYATSIEKAGDTRVAAIIAHKNKIISFGHCQRKTHPFQAQYSNRVDAIFLHAENHAIVNALRVLDIEDLRRCTLYVARIRYFNKRAKTFQWGSACPCKGCMRAIVAHGIKRVVYTTNEHTLEVLERSE